MRKELTAFRIPAETLKDLRRIKKERGITISSQVYFALRFWIEHIDLVLTYALKINASKNSL